MLLFAKMFGDWGAPFLACLREVGPLPWSYCPRFARLEQASENKLARSVLLRNLSMFPRNPRPMKRPNLSSQADTKSPANQLTRISRVLFDLDGTLIDSNYQHVNAWSEALMAGTIVIPRWKIHRRVGMSGKSMLQELLRETPRGKRRPNLDQLEKTTQ